MSRFVTVYLLLLIVLISLLQISQGKFNDKRIHSDSSDSMSSSAERDLKKLRYYLLTSNADERAARREQANSLRRELIREYLDSITDPDPDRFSEMQKRYKTFCHSSEDLLVSNQAACG